jgi:hypothetical protein
MSEGVRRITPIAVGGYAIRKSFTAKDPARPVSQLRQK